MKQFRNYSLLAGAMLTLAFASCSNDGVENVPLEKPVAAQVMAGIDGVVTRAADASWESGDAIGISCSSEHTTYGNMKYVTASGDGNFTHDGGAASGIFFQGTENVTFSAYYPFDEPEGGGHGAGWTIFRSTTDQANQKYFDYLYADNVTTNYQTPIISFTGNNKFRHMMTRLILVIETSADAGFNASDVASGTYSISGIKHKGDFYPLDRGMTITTEEVTNDWEITAIPTDVDNKRTYSMILFPQYDQKTPTLTFKAVINGQTYSADIKPDLVASYSYTYTITVKKDGLTVSNCTIDEWGTGQTGSGEAKL